MEITFPVPTPPYSELKFPIQFVKEGDKKLNKKEIVSQTYYKDQNLYLKRQVSLFLCAKTCSSYNLSSFLIQTIYNFNIREQAICSDIVHMISFLLAQESALGLLMVCICDYNREQKMTEKT